MPPGGGGSDPAPAGASYHAGPHQVGFANLFHGGGFFADGNGEGGYPDGTAAMAFDEGGEDGTVEPVEAHGVHVEHDEGGADGLEVDVAGAVNVGVVADAAKQPVGEREAISTAASGSMPTPMILAARLTTWVRSGVS